MEEYEIQVRSREDSPFEILAHASLIHNEEIVKFTVYQVKVGGEILVAIDGVLSNSIDVDTTTNMLYQVKQAYLKKAAPNDTKQVSLKDLKKPIFDDVDLISFSPSDFRMP